MICVGGAVPHSYLFVVFPGQLELCPLGFQGAWCSGPSLHSLLLPVDLEALPGWIRSVGSGLLLTVCSFAPVSHLHLQPIFPVFVK